MRINPFAGPMPTKTAPSTPGTSTPDTSTPDTSTPDTSAAASGFSDTLSKARDLTTTPRKRPRRQPPKETPKPRPEPPIVTTQAVGEEGGGPPLPENPKPPGWCGTPPPHGGGDTKPPMGSTKALGEEGGSPPRPEIPKPPRPIGPPEMTTMALGEEGGGPIPIDMHKLPGGGVGVRGPFLIEDQAPPRDLAQMKATRGVTDV